MDASAFVVIAGLVASLLSGRSDRVILLPEDDGSVGKIIVSGQGGEQLLDQPYAAVAVGQSGTLKPYKESADDVKARYRELLTTLPQAVRSYLLYFKSGGSELTEESQQLLQEIKRDVAHRVAPEIRVIGHTDTVGSKESNEALSLQRAEEIAEKLKALGMTSMHLEVIGRGEIDPLVQTADEVNEAQNRRVEISIR